MTGYMGGFDVLTGNSKVAEEDMALENSVDCEKEHAGGEEKNRKINNHNEYRTKHEQLIVKCTTDKARLPE